METMVTNGLGHRAPKNGLKELEDPEADDRSLRVCRLTQGSSREDEYGNCNKRGLGWTSGGTVWEVRL